MNNNSNNDTNDIGNLTEYERWLNSSECEDLQKAYEESLFETEYGELGIHKTEDNTYEDLEKINIKDIVKDNLEYNKLTIICDFDNTIAKSSECAIKLYEKRTNTVSNRVVTSYNFDQAMPLYNRQQQNDIFTAKEFYDMLEPYNDCVDVLYKLHLKGHRLIIATITKSEANTYKREWIKRYLPFINEVVQIDNFVQGSTVVRMNKDFIVGDLIIDDHTSNLKGNKSEYKLLFGDNFYSKGWTGDVALDWKQVEEYVEYIEMIESGINYNK